MSRKTNKDGRPSTEDLKMEASHLETPDMLKQRALLADELAEALQAMLKWFLAPGNILPEVHFARDAPIVKNARVALAKYEKVLQEFKLLAIKSVLQVYTGTSPEKR